MSRIASNGRAHSGSRDPWAKRTMPRMSVLAGGSEAARAALALLERVDDVERDLHHRDHHELRDALERLHDERLLAAVPARDEHLSLVIGIDEAHQVAEHDAVLVPEAR